MNHHEQHANLDDLLKGGSTVMYTTVDPRGTLVSRPMTVQEVEGSIIRFVTQSDNDVARDSEGKQVNLALADGGTFASLSGSGRVENDLAKKRELSRLTVSAGENWIGDLGDDELFDLFRLRDEAVSE